MLIFVHVVSQPVSCSAVGTAHPTGVYLLSERVGAPSVLWLFFHTIYMSLSVLTHVYLSTRLLGTTLRQTGVTGCTCMQQTDIFLYFLPSLVAITTEPKITVCFKGRVHLVNRITVIFIAHITFAAYAVATSYFLNCFYYI